MYRPDPNSAYRVKLDFRVDFTNAGYVQGKEFLLDLAGDSISEVELETMIVEAMNLARAGRVTILKKEVVRRGEHDDAAPKEDA